MLFPKVAHGAKGRKKRWERTYQKVSNKRKKPANLLKHEGRSKKEKTLKKAKHLRTRLHGPKRKRYRKKPTATAKSVAVKCELEKKNKHKRKQMTSA